ncbi:MAG: ABC transporter substrate-binding protein [Clostridia bacterium]|nr:ABC transporter substrate-binding protein [Clostridia bacterium]
MKKIIALALALMFVLGAASFASAEEYKQEVVIGLRQQFTTLDPQALANTAQNQILKFFHSTLVDLNTVTGEIVPDLAESWTWVDDKTIEFKLFDNATFHNGESVTANDVAFTVERGRDAVATKARYANVESVEVVDAKTVRIHLVKPNVDTLDTLALPCCSILSEKAVTEDAENGYRIGAGPWVVREFVDNDYLAFDRFDAYHFGPTKMPKMKIRYIPEDSARGIALQTGEIDLCEHILPIDLPLFEDDKNVQVIVYDSPACQYFAFNYQKEGVPTADAKVRHAINTALNREEIIMATKDGFGTPGKTYWGMNQYGYYDGFEGDEYNVEKAKQMLAEAGYPDGFDFDLMVISGERVISAEVIQAQLKKIGINVTIHEVDSAGLSAAVSAGDYTACLWGIGFNSCGDEVRRVYHSNGSNNRSHYSNPKVDELIDAAVVESDDATRKDLYKQIQEIAYQDLPIINLYYENEIYGAVKGLDGIEWGCSTANDMSFAYVVVG